MYGRRNIDDGKMTPVQPFAIYANPFDTIGAIKSKIEEMTNVPADTFNLMTIPGLSKSMKLDNNATVSESIANIKNMLFAIVLQKSIEFKNEHENNQSDALLKKIDTQRCIAKAHYKPSPTEDLKTGEIISRTGSDGKPTTILRFEGKEYPNAMEWLLKAFNNSGKACHVKIEQSNTVNTPRPKVYLPPGNKSTFGRFY